LHVQPQIPLINRRPSQAAATSIDIFDLSDISVATMLHWRVPFWSFKANERRSEKESRPAAADAEF
jgi:hypothetical protein